MAQAVERLPSACLANPGITRKETKPETLSTYILPWKCAHSRQKQRDTITGRT
jgi:hypothetical protein